MCTSAINLARALLEVIFYAGDGSKNVVRLPVSEANPEEVMVDIEKWRWHFMSGTPKEQCLDIGTGVRVPDGEFSGPMMVIDRNNSDHQKNADANIRLFEENRLTP